MVQLGDPHNFGKRVYKIGNIVYKPREVFFEWLFLSPKSDLVNFFKEIKPPNTNRSILESFPIVNFDRYNHSELSNEEVAVSLVEVDKQNANTLSPVNFISIGHAISTMLFFGFTDMHFQNILFGKDKTGKFIFGPIDIECIFENLYLLSQTRLLPTHDFSERDCGLGELKQYMFEFPDNKNICHILLGYLEGIRFLYENVEQIKKIIFGYNLNQKKIRVIIKPTRSYYSLLNNFVDAGLYAEEKIQVSRGDIPYFFKFLSSSDVYYYDSNNSYVPINLISADSEKHGGCVSWLKQSIAESEVIDQMKIGCLQLLRFFCPTNTSGNEVVDGLKIAYNKNDIFVEYKDLFSVKTNRYASFKYETK